MGGYGIPVGETERHKIFLMVSCSSEYKSYSFVIETIDGERVDLDDIGYNKENKIAEELEKEIENNFKMYSIKDEGQRSKAEFELNFRSVEKENVELKQEITSLKERISNAKSIL